MLPTVQRQLQAAFRDFRATCTDLNILGRNCLKMTGYMASYKAGSYFQIIKLQGLLKKLQRGNHTNPASRRFQGLVLHHILLRVHGSIDGGGIGRRRRQQVGVANVHPQRVLALQDCTHTLLDRGYLRRSYITPGQYANGNSFDLRSIKSADLAITRGRGEGWCFHKRHCFAGSTAQGVDLRLPGGQRGIRPPAVRVPPRLHQRPLRARPLEGLEAPRLVEGTYPNSTCCLRNGMLK